MALLWGEVQLGFRGLGFRVEGLGFWGLGVRVNKNYWGLGFGLWGFGVQGFEV